MKQSKSSNYSKASNKKTSLEDFVSFCIDESVKTSYDGGNLWDVDDKISKVYDFEKEAAIRMYSPVFDYLACLNKKRELLIECNCTLAKTTWTATEKAKNLSLEEKKTIAEEIIKENKEYFSAIISKFNLNILLQ